MLSKRFMRFFKWLQEVKADQFQSVPECPLQPNTWSTECLPNTQDSPSSNPFLSKVRQPEGSCQAVLVSRPESKKATDKKWKLLRPKWIMSILEIIHPLWFLWYPKFFSAMTPVLTLEGRCLCAFWSPYSFTTNPIGTDPQTEVVLRRDDPICHIAPFTFP